MEQPLFERPNFHALNNALYHTERSRALDFRNRALNFLTIVLGAGVVSKMGDRIGIGSWLELSTVVAATLQLVFDFGGRARTHDFLQRRYYEFLADIEGKSLESDEEKRMWSAKFTLICSEEPVTMRALSAIAYNQAVDATVYDSADRKAQRLKINWWQRIMRNWCAFQNVDFPFECPTMTPPADSGNDHS